MTFLAENLIKIITLVVSIIVILGTVIQFISFKICVEQNQREREFLNFNGFLLGANFFTEQKSLIGITENRRGVFDVAKLDSLSDISGLVTYPYTYFVKITDDDKVWKYGDESLKSEIERLELTKELARRLPMSGLVNIENIMVKYYHFDNPVAIKYSDRTVAGKMSVYIIGDREEASAC